MFKCKCGDKIESLEKASALKASCKYCGFEGVRLFCNDTELKGYDNE